MTTARARAARETSATVRRGGRPRGARSTIAAGPTGPVLAVHDRSRVAIVRRVADRGTIVHATVHPIVHPTSVVRREDHPRSGRSTTAALRTAGRRAARGHSTGGIAHRVAGRGTIAQRIAGPGTIARGTIARASTGERPQGYKPRDGRPFDSRGPARRDGPGSDRPYENRARPTGPRPEGSRASRPAWTDRERPPSRSSGVGDRPRPREREERFVPRDRDDRSRREGPGATGRPDRGGAGRPERPRSAPAGERRENTPPRPEGPPPGPGRPPRPGQEPPPVPGRSEDIVIPPEPPERGRNVDGPAGTRLNKRPHGNRR